MILNCESHDLDIPYCHKSLEVSDVIDPKDNNEFIAILQELQNAGWYIDMGDNPHDIRVFCPEHGEPLKMQHDFDAIVKGLEV